jgi:SAM-dependent methyltransferase
MEEGFLVPFNRESRAGGYPGAPAGHADRGSREERSMNDEALEKLVEEEMEAYFNEHRLPEDRRRALLFDRRRFVRTIAWLSELDLEGKEILDLGEPTVATRVLRRSFPRSVIVNTDFEFRARFPYEAGSFDLILCMEVIEHIFDIEPRQATTFSGVRHVLSECLRILRHDGILFLTTPNACSTWAIQRALLHQPPLLYDHHFREFTHSEMIDLIQEAGFQVKKAATEKVWHFWESFQGIEELMRQDGYSLDNRGDDTFVLAVKA